MEMVEGTLPVWIILSVVGFLALNALAYFNYHLSKMDKMKARCLRKKPAEQRNNRVLRLERLVDERYYAWMVFILYTIISICFCVENHSTMLLGEYLFLKVLMGLCIWFVTAVAVSCFMVALMTVCQENAIRDLKNYYQRHFGVTVISVDRDDEREYYNYEYPEP